MTDHAPGAMLARLRAYAATLLTWMQQAWDSPRVYRRGEHYMRGPGPKWREKHGYDRAPSCVAREPVALGDKWDF